MSKVRPRAQPRTSFIQSRDRNETASKFKSKKKKRHHSFLQFLNITTQRHTAIPLSSVPSSDAPPPSSGKIQSPTSRQPLRHPKTTEMPRRDTHRAITRTTLQVPLSTAFNRGARGPSAVVFRPVVRKLRIHILLSSTTHPSKKKNHKEEKARARGKHTGTPSPKLSPRRNTPF